MLGLIMVFDMVFTKARFRVVKLVTLSGDEVLCDEMLTEVFEVESGALASERAAVCKLPSKVGEIRT